MSDISGSGITRSKIYMQKIAMLNIVETEMTWFKLKEINKIRNLLLHCDGQLNNHDGTVKKEKKILSQLKPHISGEDEIIIEASFLPFVLEVFDGFFRYLNNAIKGRVQ